MSVDLYDCIVVDCKEIKVSRSMHMDIFYIYKIVIALRDSVVPCRFWLWLNKRYEIVIEKSKISFQPPPKQSGMELLGDIRDRGWRPGQGQP